MKLFASGEFIAILTTLSWTICVFPFTEASRRLGPVATNHFRLLIALLMLSVTLFVTDHLLLNELFYIPSFQNWIWLGLSGVVGLALGDYFGFTMYAILGTRKGSIFTTMSPATALFFGFLLLGEGINTIGFFGILLTIAGVSYITINKSVEEANTSLEHGTIRRGVIFGILAAICQGIGLVMTKKGMEGVHNGISPIHATWIRIIAATFFVFLLSFSQGKGRGVWRTIKQNNQKGLQFALLGTIFGPVLGVCLSVYSINKVEVSVAQTIFSLVPVFVLPFAYVIYKEVITLKVFLGTLIALAGVLILIWREALQALLFNL